MTSLPDLIPVDSELEARATARLGQLLRGKYRLDRLLGVGGMAAVFAATHRNGKEVALKLMHPEFACQSDVLKRFLREGLVANTVKHPGAVEVIDDDVTETGEPFLVMELLAGVTVQALWEQHSPMHPGWVTAITLQVLDVMVAAHAHGVIHRDLKPENLFVTVDGEVKVLDFGIARMRAHATLRTTSVGTLLGTPSFMPPEQAMGSPKDISEATDIWAVASVAFALLVGEVVHPAESVHEALIFAATRAARPLGPLAPDTPRAIAAALDRALCFDRADRWPSAAAMRDALAVAGREAYGELPGAEVLRIALGGGPSRVSSPRPVAEMPTLAAPPSVAAPARLELPSTIRTLELPSLHATLRGLETASTSTSTSASAAPPRERVARAERVRARALAAATIAVVAFSVAWMRSGAHSAAPDSAAIATAGAPIPEAAKPLVEPEPEVGQAAEAADASPPLATSPPPVARTPSPTPKSMAATTTTPRRSSTVPVAPPAPPRCDIPYTVDGLGRKHFIPQCFLAK